MNASPDRDLIEEISTDLGVDPSFVEKDWQATQLVAVVAGVTAMDVTPVFSGGTSLSKGYGLIQRFSEDLDFKVQLPYGDVNRSRRREYRKQLITAIRQNSSWQVPNDRIESRNESRFFSCRIEYTPIFETAATLRQHVRLEMSFKTPALATQTRPIQSFIAQARDSGPEVNSIACVSPAETAADKLSALTWRVLTRDRNEERDDPTLIRHLHDLATLESQAVAEPDFPNLLRELLDHDANRGTGPTDGSDLMNLKGGDLIRAALENIENDPEYAQEYQDFVMSMSYASNSETPSFERALQTAYRLQENTSTPTPPGSF